MKERNKPKPDEPETAMKKKANCTFTIFFFELVSLCSSISANNVAHVDLELLIFVLSLHVLGLQMIGMRTCFNKNAAWDKKAWGCGSGGIMVTIWDKDRDRWFGRQISNPPLILRRTLWTPAHRPGRRAEGRGAAGAGVWPRVCVPATSEHRSAVPLKRLTEATCEFSSKVSFGWSQRW